MVLAVEILNIEETDNTLDVSVSVTVDDTESVDYSLFITDTGTGGEVTRNGELFGGSGSFPGDSNIEKVSFGLGDTTGGTVSAVITEPARYEGPEFQDQQNWGDTGSGDPAAPEITLSDCEVSRTAKDDLKVVYTIAPQSRERVEPEITVRVDSRYVGDATHIVPPRGGRFSQTIPAVDLPEGVEMPVEIGHNGNFSECGTVTTDGAAPQDGSIVASGCSVTANGRSVTGEVTLTGTSPNGEVVLTLLSDETRSGPFDSVAVGTQLSNQTAQITGKPEWPAGEQTVSIEAAVTGADGSVLDADTVECGSVTLPEAGDQQPPESGGERSCADIRGDHGGIMAEYGEPGQVFDAFAIQKATEAFRRGELDVIQFQSLQVAFEQDCRVPEQPTGDGDLPLTEIAIGAGVVGVGLAARRFL